MNYLTKFIFSVILFLNTVSSKDILVKEDDLSLSIDPFQINEKILFYGDFNGDRHTDVFTVSSDRQRLVLYKWDPEGNNAFFIKSGEGKFHSIELLDFKGDFEILAASGADFNNDGKLDVLIFGQNQNQKKSFRIFYQNNKNSYSGDYLEFDSEKEPIIFDSNGDMYQDLMYQINSKIMILENIKGNKFVSKQFPISRPLADVDSTAFVDLDGDCRPELALTTQTGNTVYLDIYQNSKNGFDFSSPAKTFKMGSNTGYLTYADFDGDATTDILIPTQSSLLSDPQIHIFYNKRNSGEIFQECSQRKTWLNFDQNIFETGSDRQKIVQIFSEKLAKGPIRIRIGDLNKDGIPDFLVPIEENKVQIWIMNSNGVASRAVGDKARLEDREDIEHASFFDMGDNGILDIFLITKSGSVFLRNNYGTDANFITTFVSNDNINPDKRSYGVIQSGPTTMIKSKDFNGNERVHIASQLPQSSNLALQLPYSFIGLGKSSSYINSLALGLQVNGKNLNFKTRKGVIPNSKLILHPRKDYKPNKWKLELRLDHPKSLIWVLVGVLICIVVLTFWIGFFTYRERKQDLYEKARNVFAF